MRRKRRRTRCAWCTAGCSTAFRRSRWCSGHLGETLPYFAWRIQHCFEFNPAGKRLERRLQDYLCDNVYVSTSGFFSDQALIGAVLTIGADRILFAVDYPYEPMDPATDVDRARAHQ